MKTYIYSFKNGEEIEVEASNRDVADKKFSKTYITEGYSGIFDVYILNEETGEKDFVQTQSTNYVKGE